MPAPKIKFDSERCRYTVTAHDERFAVMWKPMNALKTYLYVLTDLERGVRGGSNMIFGIDEDPRNAEEADKILADLQSGELAVSWRYSVPMSEAEIRQVRSLSSAH